MHAYMLYMLLVLNLGEAAEISIKEGSNFWEKDTDGPWAFWWVGRWQPGAALIRAAGGYWTVTAACTLLCPLASTLYIVHCTMYNGH